MRNWASKYIGKKWQNGGRGPDAFDCWGLLYWTMREDFMTEVPTFPIDPGALWEVQQQIEAESKSTNWVQRMVPEEGCAVGLSHGAHFHHVGQWTEQDGGLVIHCLDGSGVVADSLAQLRASGWRRIEFYVPASWLK